MQATCKQHASNMHHTTSRNKTLRYKTLKQGDTVLYQTNDGINSGLYTYSRFTLIACQYYLAQAHRP